VIRIAEEKKYITQKRLDIVMRGFACFCWCDASDRDNNICFVTDNSKKLCEIDEEELVSILLSCS
jgi:hypothetical protein